ncbi:DUF6162 family protein [Photobacterium rosenbergii]|uniref:Uncharacterized protein n=1 Tax=Photobacterium rosenbergii TaxID=294936 RepID=A0ABU3ZC84_9GAMM|nr:hypothetical protein [Photobacterium rosenbergii]MDV5167603.1 hypothetical protein [Photobacterium rosenbergii]
MITEAVKADDGGTEGKWVALAIAVILAIGFLSLPFHQAGHSELDLEAYQVSIKDMPANELSMIAELRLAHEEIRNVFHDNSELLPADKTSSDDPLWPQVAELESLWLPPFIKDKSWEHKGRHRWQLVEGGAYIGVPEVKGSDDTVIAVLLISTEIEPNIWFKPFPAPNAIETPSKFSSSALAKSGWFQVSFVENKQQHSH